LIFYKFIVFFTALCDLKLDELRYD